MARVAESDRIADVYVVTPDVHEDARGLFIETYRREWVPGAREMVQGNRADRRAESLVGMHYHLNQADYWYVPAGHAVVALHDLRRDSPTERATVTLDLGPAHDHRAVYVPPGVAHGFWAVTHITITYLVDHYYDPDDELGVIWDDPGMGIPWPGDGPVLSARDEANPGLTDVPDAQLPRWTADPRR